MKVHFSAPLHKLDKHLATYMLIESTIKESGHNLAKEWLQAFRDRQGKPGSFSDAEWQDINDNTLVAVQEADAVIIEASIPSFSMGYLSAVALAHKKPLLMLFKSRPQSYILDANNSLRRAETYTSDGELKQIISNFLKDVDIDGNNLRFNMALDRETYNFLNWESVNTGKTKAQIIRELLKERIHRG
jgi:hypothetical protein